MSAPFGYHFWPVGDFLKSLGGKIASGVISLAVVAAAVAWWETDPATKQQIRSDTGRLLGWILLVLIVPWASFALIAWISRLQSNGAGAALILFFTVIESVLLAWLCAWSVRGATEWVLFIAAALIAGVYNLFACDWIAEKME